MQFNNNHMALYRYVKAPPAAVRAYRKPFGLSFLLMGLGGSMLLWALWPIVSFSVISEQYFSSIVTPVSEFQSGCRCPGIIFP